MKLIDGNKAQHGVVVTAKKQTNGKGQRGKTWVGEVGQSLMMSIIVQPNMPIGYQFAFNASIAVAIASVLEILDNKWEVKIKWPNDIIINDKKAGGILIENVLRGNIWVNAIIGLGLNINQSSFPVDLPFAISLKMAANFDFDLEIIRDKITDNILSTIENKIGADEIMGKYNERLYKRGKLQMFAKDGQRIELLIIGAATDGTLKVQNQSGDLVSYRHGKVIWEYC